MKLSLELYSEKDRGYDYIREYWIALVLVWIGIKIAVYYGLGAAKILRFLTPYINIAELPIMVGIAYFLYQRFLKARAERESKSTKEISLLKTQIVQYQAKERLEDERKKVIGLLKYRKEPTEKLWSNENLYNLNKYLKSHFVYTDSNFMDRTTLDKVRGDLFDEGVLTKEATTREVVDFIEDHNTIDDIETIIGELRGFVRGRKKWILAVARIESGENPEDVLTEEYGEFMAEELLEMNPDLLKK